MRLADHILAARGSILDVGECCTTLGGAILNAQRFEMEDNVVIAAGNLVGSKPSTLVKALPMCRPPYPVMWVEYRGGLGPNQWGVSEERPAPVKQGFLLEQFDPKIPKGIITLAWIHRREGLREREPEVYKVLEGHEFVVNICPMGICFDFTKDADVLNTAQVARAPLVRMIAERRHGAGSAEAENAVQSMLSAPRNYPTLDEIREVVRKIEAKREDGFGGYHQKIAHRDDELQALIDLERTVVPLISFYGLGYVAEVATSSGMAGLNRISKAWEQDTSGEGAYIQALLVLMNARNKVVETTPVDLTKLNKARTRSGKAPFVNYSITRIKLNQTQTRVAAAQGLTREQMRQHSVMGHFKVRRSGVFWWNPFLRGDPTKPLARDHYTIDK